MAHLIIYIPRINANGKTIDNLFTGEVVSKVPTDSEIELIEEQEGYTLRAYMDKLPERGKLRIALAKMDVHLGKLGIFEYGIWVSVDRLSLNGVFYRASEGENVNGKIESELNKVYCNGL